MMLTPDDRHHAFRDDCVEILRKHGAALIALEMLALAAHLVGQLVAMQDQRRITPATAMEVVAKNIEHGNREVLNQLHETAGST